MTSRGLGLLNRALCHLRCEAILRSLPSVYTPAFPVSFSRRFVLSFGESGIINLSAITHSSLCALNTSCLIRRLVLLGSFEGLLLPRLYKR